MRAMAIFLGGILWCANLAWGQSVESERGLVAHVDVDYGPALRAKASQTPMSPVLVRTFDVEPGGHQRIEFIGTVAGSYDLRDFVEREDGRALGAEFPSLPVVVVSRLPADAGTDLYGAREVVGGWRVHYRELLWGAGILWLAIPGVALVRRALRAREVEPPAPAPPEPTLADQICALLDAGRECGLSVDECGQLELLVFRFLTGDTPARDADEVARIVRALREEPRTRELVAAIEEWLHSGDARAGAHEQAVRALEAFRRSRLSGGNARASEVGA